LQLASTLVEALNPATNADEVSRGMCAVLLRRHLSRGAEAWAQVGAETRQRAKASLLQALFAEPSRPNKRKAAHAIAEVACTLAGDACSGWPELLPAVFQIASAEDDTSREIALFVFQQLAEYSGAELLEAHIQQLVAALTPLIADCSNAVRIAAMKVGGRRTAAPYSVCERGGRRRWGSVSPRVWVRGARGRRTAAPYSL
jgi:hypothetical protein